MEYSSASWFNDMGLEDPRFIHSCEMSSLDQFTTQHIAHALGAEDFHHRQQQNSSSESYTSLYTCATVDLPKNGGATVETTTTTTDQACRPAKVPKTSSWNSCTTTKQVSAVVPDASSPTILSFGSVGVNNNSAKSKDASEFSISRGSVPIRGSKRGGGGGDATDRPFSSTRDHILSERRRREKLSQRFIALSAIVPGLKKMDKASVLCDAIKYVKQLEDKVKTLEDQATKKTVESAVLVKKSQVPFDDDTSSTDENFDGQQTLDESLPEIEAKVSESTVLLRVHCEKKKGLLVRVLAEIERFHLGVVNTSVVPFAGSILDITIVAQMEEEFNMTVKDLVKNLRTIFREFK